MTNDNWNTYSENTEMKRAGREEGNMKDKIKNALIESLTDAYSCTRVWEAWQVGTMTEHDFSLISEDEELLDEISEEILKAIYTP